MCHLSLYQVFVCRFNLYRPRHSAPWLRTLTMEGHSALPGEPVIAAPPTRESGDDATGVAANVPDVGDGEGKGGGGAGDDATNCEADGEGGATGDNEGRCGGQGVDGSKAAGVAGASAASAAALLLSRSCHRASLSNVQRCSSNSMGLPERSLTPAPASSSNSLTTSVTIATSQHGAAGSTAAKALNNSGGMRSRPRSLANSRCTAVSKQCTILSPHRLARPTPATTETFRGGTCKSAHCTHWTAFASAAPSNESTATC
mmetsp:Transcript_74598/g.242279  ORF Transcript_74598/g.242279 Transcript_74598/m.242279 type:complete len:259 (+) Transcript_74598:1899-2675(+)